MKVLIIKSSSIGDIIHTLPAVTDAFRLIPNILFDWVVEEIFSEIPTWHPAVCQIIPINLRLLRKWYRFDVWRRYFQCIGSLKNEYDVIIDAQGLLKTSLLVTNITNGNKHGMDYVSVRESISCWFYHQRHFIEKNQHAVERIRKLFANSLQYFVPKSVGQYNIDYLFPYQKQCNRMFYLLFFHTTSKSKKDWLDFNWRRLIQYAIDLGYNIRLPFWTDYERSRVYRLSEGYERYITILPNLTLKQIALQISKAKAVISLDTGLGHLTAALGCPNLMLYGPTNPKLVGPYGRNQKFLCSPTNNMKHLTVKNVWKEFKKVLNNNY